MTQGSAENLQLKKETVPSPSWEQQKKMQLDLAVWFAAVQNEY